MPRRPRALLGDGVFHVTARGNSRATIFVDEIDYRGFLKLLTRVADRHAWLVHAYCLMPNHFHLIVEARGIDLSGGMGALNGGYAQYFNNRHDRSGHLFQGRYDARLVDDDRFTDVREYVLENPVRAGLCASVEEYRWCALLLCD
jgi:REP element-mobilizing transposase RayT